MVNGLSYSTFSFYNVVLMISCRDYILKFELYEKLKIYNFFECEACSDNTAKTSLNGITNCINISVYTRKKKYVEY